MHVASRLRGGKSGKKTGNRFGTVASDAVETSLRSLKLPRNYPNHDDPELPGVALGLQ